MGSQILWILFSGIFISQALSFTLENLLYVDFPVFYPRWLCDRSAGRFGRCVFADLSSIAGKGSGTCINTTIFECTFFLYFSYFIT